MKTKLVAAFLLLHLVAVSRSQVSDNIDTRQPILRSAPTVQTNGLFGYSLVLHQTGVPNGMTEALSMSK